MKVAVIGGGIAGLVASRDLAAAGSGVVLFERGARMGGQAGSFELEPGVEIERFYHFICRGDAGYLGMLEELDIAERLRWRTTAMGLFHRGRLHTFGDPLSLLVFPHLSATDKLRFALTTAAAKFRSVDHWHDLEHVTAEVWLRRSYGDRAWELLYRPLLDSKFRSHASRVSAAWMWARIHRLGNSRSRLQEERIGYLEGGSQLYVDRLEDELVAAGVELRPRTAVDRVLVDGDRLRGVEVEGDAIPFDAVISTVPIPYTGELFRGLGGPYFDGLRALEYLGVVVLVLRLKRSFSRYYWTNVSDPEIPFSGIIEATNLNPLPALGGDAVLYVPQYLDHGEERYRLPDERLLELYVEALAKIRSDFDRDWIRSWAVHRERYTQPVCPLGFSSRIPNLRAPIAGLYVTDSYQLNPHDRAISFSTDLGRAAARAVLEDRA